MDSEKSSHIKGVLDSFARHLRIRRSEGDVTRIAQMYLALGCNVVPTQRVYDAISSDYELLALKTQNPPLSDYAHTKRAPVDPETFVEIIKKGYSKQKGTYSEFDSFVDAVVLNTFANEEAPEKWIEACRKDKWKDVALFLSLNYKENPKFHTLLKTIIGQEDVTTLRKRLLDYKPIDKNAFAEDMTKLIKSIRISDEATLSFSSSYSFVDEETIPSIKKEVPPPFVEQSLLIEVESSSSSESNKTGMIITPVMEVYRKRAGLPAIIEPKRIAKQMIAASLMFENSASESVVYPSGVLLRSQTKLEPLLLEEEKALVSEFIQSNLFDSKVIQKALLNSKRAQIVAQACNQKKWDAKTLLAHVIDPKSQMDERSYAKWAKIEKNIGDDHVFLETLFS
jgi:hypothetical protein